jgi:DNA-binding transcriptional LysR family regulator
VKALEDELGHQLLDRDGKKMQVTPAGEHLLHHAEKILEEMAVARASLDRRMRWGMNRLRVSVNAKFSQYLLPGILQLFYKEFPRMQVNVTIGDTRQCLAWLEENDTDVAIVVAPNRAGAVEMIPLFTDEVAWIVPPKHAWAQAAGASPQEIESENFICTSMADYTSRLLEKHLGRDGIRLKCTLELGNLESVKEMVKAGAGITAMAPWVVKKELDEGSLVVVPLGKRKLKRNWGLLRSLNRTPTLAAEKFAKFSFEVTKSLAPYASVLTILLNTLLPDCDVGLDFLAVDV